MKSSYTFGVVGYRISYSRSPEIFKTVGLIKNFTSNFVSHDIAPDRFGTEFPKVLKSGIDGFSVTIPHKLRVVDLLDHVDPRARKLGAVNSVCVRDGESFGYNTDGFGFALPLGQHRDQLTGSTALVVGAGGASRAVVNCLVDEFGVERVYLLGRDRARLEEFRTSAVLKPDQARIEVVTYDEHKAILDRQFSIIVNCTPLGGWNHLDEDPLPGKFDWQCAEIYYDLSYNEDNKLVARADDLGLAAYDGSIMLIGQALRSFFLWTEETVEFDHVYEAVFGRE